MTATAVQVAGDAGLSALDLACGFVYGTQPAMTSLPVNHSAGSARAALEACVLRALLRPPCAVSFSGGRDSSAVLALAAHVAAREGLDPPVPITLRFPEAEGADEDEWQEIVIRHIGIPDWERVALTDEMDVVGPYARTSLLAHGLLWPHNTYFHLPIAERARGGTVLTGVGGDEVMLPGRWARLHRVLRGHVRPSPRDVAHAAAALGPRSVRRALLRRGLTDTVGWLQPAAEHERQRTRVDVALAEPFGWDRWVRERWWTCRARVLGEASMRMLVAEHDAVALHPFEDRDFLGRMAVEGGPPGFPTRTHAMGRLFADLLPADLVRRGAKAFFNHAFHHRHSRAFAATWDGRDVDDRWVDPERLRSAWTAPLPDHRSGLLMQALWLAGQP